MSKTPKLKEPIEILISARNSGGLLCSVVRTVDGGAASVTWDFKTKSWVFAKGLTIGIVFAAKPASASEIMAGDVPGSMAWLEEDEEIIYLDNHGKIKQPPPTLNLKNFSLKNFLRWLKYILTEKRY